MNNWHPSIISFIEKQNYEQVVKFYEEIIENNPEEITNYWYLGLAYLLNRQEEEAKVTWFIPFTNSDELKTELFTQQLSNILLQEASQQEKQQNYELVWLIGNTIRELDPHNLSNLLYLLKLSVIINRFKPDYISEWGIIDLLIEKKQPLVDNLLLLEILDSIITLPFKINLQLATAIIFYSNKNSEILYKIKRIADQVGLDNLYSNYAIDLLELCLKNNSEDLTTYRELYTLYIKHNHYYKALEIATTLKHKITSTEGTLLVNNLLFDYYLTVGQWNKIYDIVEEQIKYWKFLIKDQEYIATDPLAKESFIPGLMSLLYVKDDLKYHRHLFNQVSLKFKQSNNYNIQWNYSSTKTTKPLKIGYIGHTFRRHSVGFLCRWLINYHNHQLFEIYIYSVQGHQDNITEKWFIPKVKKFYRGERNVNNIINQINEDQIDILIDIDSVTSNITNLVLCQKPAPIQITWLGLDASGLPTIDYYIADPYVLPDYAEQYYREKIWRLPNTYLAIEGFETATPTRRREDFNLGKDDIIFMNLQTPAKLNPDILKSQLKIVDGVPNGYLFTKIRKDEDALKELIIEIAKLENVSLEKLRFIPSDATVETHRANLQIADVILDTYPYNGSTTTLEALWAEIPVVTRVGEQFAARNSYTYMVNAGITEGIAWSDEEYIEWGIKFGMDKNLRKEVTWKLRQSKKTSPLWNVKQFTKEMEKAYEQMWQIYLKENK